MTTTVEEDKVVLFNGITRLNIPTKKVMASAAKEKFKEVIVVGFDEDGDFYFSCSQADGGDVLWLLELAKLKLMKAL